MEGYSPVHNSPFTPSDAVDCYFDNSTLCVQVTFTHADYVHCEVSVIDLRHFNTIHSYVRTHTYAYSAWCSRYYSVSRLSIAISSTALNSDDFERMYTDTMTGCEDASRFVVISLFAARVTVCHRQSRDDDDAAAEFDAQR